MKEPKREMDSSAFVILADYVPNVIQEIRYHSTYNFIGERIDGYEEPAALITLEAARALKSAGKELHVMGYQMKIFDAYRPARAVKHFVLWGLEDQDIRMKQYFYPDLEKEELFNAGYIAKQRRIYCKTVQPQPGKHGGSDFAGDAHGQGSGHGKSF